MKLLKFIANHFEEIFAAPLMIVMAVMVVIQVLCRFVFFVNTSWAEELLRYCFLWNIMLGAAIGVKMKAHIAVGMLVDNLPGIPKIALKTFSMLLMIAFCIVLFEASWSVVAVQYKSNQIMPALRAPMFTGTAALPVGLILMIIRIFQLMVSEWRLYLEAKNQEK